MREMAQPHSRAALMHQRGSRVSGEPFCLHLASLTSCPNCIWTWYKEWLDWELLPLHKYPYMVTNNSNTKNQNQIFPIIKAECFGGFFWEKKFLSHLSVLWLFWSEYGKSLSYPPVSSSICFLCICKHRMVIYCFMFLSA